MAQTTLEALQREWEILHRDHERYERAALAIKLVAVMLSLACIGFGVESILAILFVLVLWLQDGIWKTFQTRLGARLLAVEHVMRAPITNPNAPYQLYSAWEANKPGTLEMVKEYLSNALRPTVAYPYALLAAILFLFSGSEN